MTVTPDELREKFMKPLGLSANTLAFALRVPATRIGDILRADKQRAVSADTAIRLTQYFATSPEFWLNLLIFTVAAMLAVLAPLPAFSKDGKSVHACDKSLVDTLSTLDQLEALVPLVPPEESNYLSQETWSATMAMSGPRLNAVMSRSYYYAWNLHTEFANAREKLQESQNPASVSLKERIQLASLIPRAVFNASKAWDDYDRADNGKILTARQRDAGAYRMGIATGAPGLYIWCLANLLEEEK